MVIDRISREDLLALLEAGTVQLIAAAAFARLGYADVRVYAGGKQDWAEAGLAFMGSRAITGVGRPA
jgi:rhodanese-related sulfurtransferase